MSRNGNWPEGLASGWDTWRLHDATNWLLEGLLDALKKTDSIAGKKCTGVHLTPKEQPQPGLQASWDPVSLRLWKGRQRKVRKIQLFPLQISICTFICSKEQHPTAPAFPFSQAGWLGQRPLRVTGTLSVGFSKAPEQLFLGKCWLKQNTAGWTTQTFSIKFCSVLKYVSISPMLKVFTSPCHKHSCKKIVLVHLYGKFYAHTEDFHFEVYFLWSFRQETRWRLHSSTLGAEIIPCDKSLSKMQLWWQVFNIS